MRVREGPVAAFLVVSEWVSGATFSRSDRKLTRSRLPASKRTNLRYASVRLSRFLSSMFAKILHSKSLHRHSTVCTVGLESPPACVSRSVEKTGARGIWWASADPGQLDASGFYFGLIIESAENLCQGNLSRHR